MILRYNSVNDLADFKNVLKYPKTDEECNKPCMREEYRDKTFYAVLELKKDYWSDAYCGIMSHENKWYKRGYYVIPVYLQAHRWICGDKIVLMPREFCDLFGKPWSREPQDVPRDKWWIAADFKRYWGLTKTTLGYLPKYIENYELYDDVDEAISRAKELDTLMELNDKLDEVTSTIEREEGLQDNLAYKIRMNHKFTERQKLEHQICEMTYEKRNVRLSKAYDKKKRLEDKIIHYARFLKA
jgi:hypothetical protein